MDLQEQVASFNDEHAMAMAPEYRLLDLASEVGELAKEAAVSTEYGEAPADLEISPDEIGDVLYALLAFANGVDVDAEEALTTALRSMNPVLQSTATRDPGTELRGTHLPWARSV